MSDNTTLNPGVGGDVIAADDIGGVKHQLVKIEYGTLDTATYVSTSNPLPSGMYGGTIPITARPDGFLRTQSDPTTLIYDTFEILETTNTWSTGGTAPSLSAGTLSFNSGTAANAFSYLVSKVSFLPGSSAFLNSADIVSLASAVELGSKRIWGVGVIAGSPTAAIPVSNGVVYEVSDVDGLLYGVAYSNGVRTQSIALTRPTDGNVHRYAIYYKVSRAYFEIDNIQVGSIPFPNPAVASLYKLIGCFNAGGALGSNPVLTATLLGLSDTSKSFTKISDAIYPWRQASIGKSGGISVKGASTGSISGSVAVGGNNTIIGPLDVTEAANITFTVKNTTATSAYTGAPIIVFEQSDDNVSWGPLNVVRSDTTVTGTTFTLAANTANSSLMFDAAAEGVAYVRARVTTAPTGFPLTVSISGGGLPFSPTVSSVPQTITKGVQGAQGITTQDLKDSGRVNVAITGYQLQGVITTEATFGTALVQSRDGAASTTISQGTVTAGKRFRIQVLELSIKNNAAAAGTSKFVLRYSGSGGTITNTSPILAIWDVGSNSVTAANYIGPMVWSPPDGIELLSGSTYSITNLSSAVTMLHTFTLSGYEY